MSRSFIRCATLFTGLEDKTRERQTLIVEDGNFTYVGSTAEAPAAAAEDKVINAGDAFVMPGLVDTHTHLVFGNAKSEEDINIFVSPEFRAIRGLFFTRFVIAAGYTSIVCPGDAGMVSVAIRNAIDAGLFPGPRIAASSCVIANRQSLNDWFPSWVGTPDYFSGRLCTNATEAIAEVRRQAHDGVDVIKIAMDGPHFRENGESIAAYTQDETKAIVDEIHRVGKKAVTHAYGREAVLYAARAGVDIINHAFFCDDQCIEAMLKSGSSIAPTLTFPVNTSQFCQDYEPATVSGYNRGMARVVEIGSRNLQKARQAGVPFMTGSDSGFAVTPYGEWHARELEIFVERLGFTPAQALRCATSVSARAMPRGNTLGAIEVGRKADFIFVGGSPLNDIRVLQQRAAIRAVYKGGEKIEVDLRSYDPGKVSDFNTVKWNHIYTREFVQARRKS
ncbi:MAG: amidohydrolase family protein [Steroidobacteraceae bacterium]